MKYLTILALLPILALAGGDGLNVDALSGAGKKFFMDMTKQVMGVPSLKPENLAAQAFFRDFLDKYTKLDDNIKRELMKHVPAATKIFDSAAKKYNINPADAFKTMSTFFTNFKQGATGNLAQEGNKKSGVNWKVVLTGLKAAGKFLSNRKQAQSVGGY